MLDLLQPMRIMAKKTMDDSIFESAVVTYSKVVGVPIEGELLSPAQFSLDTEQHIYAQMGPNGTDGIMLSASMLGEASARGGLADLGPMVAEDTKWTSISPELRGMLSVYGGEVLAFPINIVMPFLYYRCDTRQLGSYACLAVHMLAHTCIFVGFAEPRHSLHEPISDPHTCPCSLPGTRVDLFEMYQLKVPETWQVGLQWTEVLHAGQPCLLFTPAQGMQACLPHERVSITIVMLTATCLRVHRSLWSWLAAWRA